MELQFESKCYTPNLGSMYEDSVRVKIQKANPRSKSDGVKLTFVNQWGSCISKTGYIVPAVYKNRLYFKESDAVNGWKLSSYNAGINRSNMVILTNANVLKWAREYGEGMYSIHHDKELDLYYIEKPELDFEAKR